MSLKFVKIAWLLLIINTISYAQKIPITSFSKEAILLYKDAWRLENTLKTNAAEEKYKKAIALDSSFALAHYRLAMLRDNYDYRKQKLGDALKFINTVSKGEKLLIQARVDFYLPGYDGSKEYSYVKELVALYPEDEVANYLFGFVNMHHGKSSPKLAIKHYEKAIAINPTYSFAYNELVYAYVDNTDYKNAIRIAKKYTELLPNSVLPLDTYAEIFMRNGEYEESIKQYKNVLKLDAKYPWALMGIAANLNFLNKHKQAREYIDRVAVNGLSDYEYRHKWKAKLVSFLDEGDYANAIKTLEAQKQESISGRNKREPLFHIYYAFLRKTRVYFESKQQDKGIAEYNAWLSYVQKKYKSEKTKKRVLDLENYYKAYAAYLNNNLEEAIKFLDAYEAIESTDASKNLRARIYNSQNKYSEAVALLKQTNLNDAYNKYWLAIYLKKAGKIEEAKALKLKILTLNDRNNINLALVRNMAKAIKL